MLQTGLAPDVLMDCDPAVFQAIIELLRRRQAAAEKARNRL